MEFLGRKLRHEQKYYINTHDYAALRRRLTGILSLDRNSESPDGYGIRSLYFDSPFQYALNDKVDGIFGREKYRIRVYNGRDRGIKLERKSKYGDYVCKEAARLTRGEYDGIMAGDASVLKEAAVPLLQDFYRALRSGFAPAAVVDYQREAYVFEPGDVRITFDKMLSAGLNTFDLFDSRMAFTEALLPLQTILEVKFDAFLPDFIRQLVQLPAHERSAISKYVICREVGIRYNKP